jgi:hypothetical protein
MSSPPAGNLINELAKASEDREETTKFSTMPPNRISTSCLLLLGHFKHNGHWGGGAGLKGNGL